MQKFIIREPQHGVMWSAVVWAMALGAAIATLACVESSAAQSPPAPHEARPRPPASEHGPDVHLQSLQLLLTEGVYAVQKLQATQPMTGVRKGAQDPPARREEEKEVREGSQAARLLANVRDARFDRDGRLLALHVEAPATDPRAEPSLRVLPASAVKWDVARNQWVVIEPNLQFAELEMVGDPKQPAQTPGAVPREPSLLASRLALASVDPSAAKMPPTPPPSRQGTADKPADKPPAPAEAKSAEIKVGAPPAPVVWFAPVAQRLAFVVLPIEGPPAPDGQATLRFVPLPWSLVKANACADTVQLGFVPAPEVVAAAPAATDAAERPLPALRQRCYEHFGVAVPAWDTTLTAPRTAAK